MRRPRPNGPVRHRQRRHGRDRRRAGTGNGNLSVIINGVVVGTTFHTTGLVHIRGGGGNDNITISATGQIGAEVDGEDGLTRPRSISGLWPGRLRSRTEALTDRTA